MNSGPLPSQSKLEIDDLIRQILEQDESQDYSVNDNSTANLVERIQKIEKTWSELKNDWTVIRSHADVAEKIERLWRTLKETQEHAATTVTPGPLTTLTTHDKPSLSCLTATELSDSQTTPEQNNDPVLPDVESGSVPTLEKINTALETLPTESDDALTTEKEVSDLVRNILAQHSDMEDDDAEMAPGDILVSLTAHEIEKSQIADAEKFQWDNNIDTELATIQEDPEQAGLSGAAGIFSGTGVTDLGSGQDKTGDDPKPLETPGSPDDGSEPIAHDRSVDTGPENLLVETGYTETSGILSGTAPEEHTVDPEPAVTSNTTADTDDPCNETYVFPPEAAGGREIHAGQVTDSPGTPEPARLSVNLLPKPQATSLTREITHTEADKLSPSPRLVRSKYGYVLQRHPTSSTLPLLLAITVIGGVLIFWMVFNLDSIQTETSTSPSFMAETNMGAPLLPPVESPQPINPVPGLEIWAKPDIDPSHPLDESGMWNQDTGIRTRSLPVSGSLSNTASHEFLMDNSLSKTDLPPYPETKIADQPDISLPSVNGLTPSGMSSSRISAEQSQRNTTTHYPGAGNKKAATTGGPTTSLTRNKKQETGQIISGQETTSDHSTYVWSLNLMSIYKDKLAAENELSRIKEADIHAEILRVSVGSRVWYRLHITGFSSRAEARAYLDTVTKRTGIDKYWISRKPGPIESNQPN